ncbi:AMP-binding protein [Streptosporangium sp. NPDC049078]|uniref:AMP-binding protein n=1 Tax=Streptosporangium sp. NPDC049078 TaxID=3155767 RepID=UPI003436A50A
MNSWRRWRTPSDRGEAIMISSGPDRRAALAAVLDERIRRGAAETALVDSTGDVLSYADLGALACACDEFFGQRHAERVAIVGTASIEVSASITACLWAGRTFMVVDDQESNAVRRRLIDQFAADVVLLTGPSAETTPANLMDEPVTVTGRDLSKAARQWDDQAVLKHSERMAVRTPQAAAYCVRTSGTTADPKLIEMSRAAIESYCAEFNARYGLAPGHRLALWAAPTYDALYCQLISALASGAAGVVAPMSIRNDGDAVLQWLREARITHFETTPSILRRVASAAVRPGASWPPHLTEVMCSGEWFDPQVARQVFDAAERCGAKVGLHNEYGPSECILLTWHQITPEDADSGDIPVGKAIAGRTLSIEPLDGRSGSSAQHPGEIVVESEHLCRGYGSEQAGSLVAFPAPNGVPVFRTGDLGYLDHRGRLRLSGRRDRTVKRRGVRINLDQVEAVLHALPAVGQAAARADEADGQVMIHVWIVPSDSRLDRAAVLTQITETVEVRLLPDRVVICTYLPRLHSGKVDYRSLKVADSGDEQVEVTADETTLKAVAAAFERVLPDVAITGSTDFFASGGHSLLALELSAHLERDLGVRLTIRDYLAHPTVAGLAGVVDRNRRQTPRSVSTAAPVTLGEELTSTERPIWVWSQMFPGDGALNVVGGFTTHAAITEQRLRQALSDLLKDVAQLRVRYVLGRDRPRRVLHAAGVARVDVLQISASADTFPQPEVDSSAYQPFDVGADQLVRAILVRSSTEPAPVGVYLIAHHLVCDGVSMGLLVAELQHRLGTPERRTSLSSLCVLPPARPDARLVQSAAGHWSTVRRGLKAQPYDERLRPNDAAAGASVVDWRLPTQPIRELADRLSVSRAAVLITLIARAVGRVLDRDQVVVETPVSTRTPDEVRSIGNYVVDVPLLVDAAGQDTTRVIEAVNRDLLAAVDFAALVPGFGSVRPGQGWAPVGDVVVVLEDHVPAPAVEIDGVASSATQLIGSPPRHALACYFRADALAEDITCVVTGRSDGEMARALCAEADATLTTMTKQFSMRRFGDGQRRDSTR